VPTLTQEIALNQAPTEAPAAHSPAQPFPSALDETRLCMMVTDQLLAQLPDLIRATVRAQPGGLKALARLGAATARV
jgi:hypothetical protein